MKTPRLPKNWTWDLDRTGDTVAVIIRNAQWQLVYVCLTADPRTFTLHLHRLRLMALWEAIVRRPLEEFRIETRARYAHWRQARADARSDAQMAYAASIDGLYDHKGERIERPEMAKSVKAVKDAFSDIAQALSKI